jgi:iron(III) transport system substrate-binding protein
MRMTNVFKTAFLLIVTGTLLACGGNNDESADAAESKGEVNIYSYRQENLIRPILDSFSEQTGIQVNLVTGAADGLIERLRNEAAASPADVLLTVDAGRLVRAREMDLLQAVESTTLTERIPVAYRDTDSHWFGLSKRARVIFYDPQAVSEDELPGYLELTDPRWNGQICVRSSDNIYNQSLLAAVIAHQGQEPAEQWAEGVVANMARDPQGNDRAQITGVAVGVCDLALANTYYYGRMLESSDPTERENAEQVAIHFPSLAEYGTHVNISGAGVTKHAPNRDNAVALLEFLASDTAQRFYADVNHEYPVVDSVEPGATVAGWGTLNADSLNVTRLGELNQEAVRTFDRAGWR